MLEHPLSQCPSYGPALYPNSTHLTQPMDVGVFKPLNVSWVNKAKDWRLANENAKIERKHVAPILKVTIGSIQYSELLTKAFRKSGLYPFDVESFSRILPSFGDEADSQNQLWNETSTNSQIISQENATTFAVSLLQHFERLIGDTVLNLFRSSADVWTGRPEYVALFSIWRKMYAEASNTITVAVNDSIEYDGNNFHNILIISVHLAIPQKRDFITWT